MLKLKDFFHLPQVDALIDQLLHDAPGLTLVVGLDPRPHAEMSGAESFLPSGRGTITRILMRQMLETFTTWRAVVVAEGKEAVRAPRALARRVTLERIQPGADPMEALETAVLRRPHLLIIDQLTPETAVAALNAARQGMRVLAQMDSVLRGAELLRYLHEQGVPHDALRALRWVLAVQRLTTLCEQCKQATPLPAAQQALLEQRYPHLHAVWRQPVYTAPGCPACDHSGRRGEIAAFDLFQTHPDDTAPWERSSLLPLDEYMLHLAAAGHLPVSDALRIEQDQVHHTYRLLAASEHALQAANVDLQRKLVALETAHHLLQQRTEALVSLQELGQALIASNDPYDLGQRICRHTQALCGADRAVLYYLRTPETADVLAASGWEQVTVAPTLPAVAICPPDVQPEPQPFHQLPPGLEFENRVVARALLRAGLCVPLLAQGRPVGLLLVYTVQAGGFTPGAVALLQTFANQAALALQRTGLIAQLRGKIKELETAQAELVQKERLERELELARQVQQSVLPRTFPRAPGLSFAARSETARRVGGDLYDVIDLAGDDGHERVGLVIADVSGKGMPAALYMALTRSLLLAETRRGLGPRAVLERVNQLLLELGQPQMFVTVFYGILDCRTRRLTYARAGHDHPLLLRRGRGLPLGGEGTVLGFLEDTLLSEEEIALEAGDRLALYTDGLTDVEDAHGRLFDRARLTAVLLEHAALPPEALCDATFAALAAYQGTAEQFDDMTLLVVAVEGARV